MKLTVSPIVVDESNPFDADKLRRDTFGNVLLNLVKVTEEHLVIALNAPWGEGKTTFVKMWQSLLRQNAIHSIYFDAFENDHLNEPFVALVSEINAFTEKLPQKHPAKKTAKEFKKTAISVGGQLLSISARAAIKTATVGIVNETELEAFQDVLKGISQGSSEFVTQYIKAKIDNYTRDKATIHSFQKQFHSMIQFLLMPSSSRLLLCIPMMELILTAPNLVRPYAYSIR